jgi:hypothetical protein
MAELFGHPDYLTLEQPRLAARLSCVFFRYPEMWLSERTNRGHPDPRR